MNKSYKFLFILVFFLVTGSACNLPSNESISEINVTSTQTITETPTLTLTPDNTVTMTTTQKASDCKPTVTTTVDANVRNGPGLVYLVLGVIPMGGEANIEGKNSVGDWWYIEFAGGGGGHGWIAGSVTTASCIPDTLAIIAASPAPVVAVQSNPTKAKETNSNNTNSNQDNSSPVISSPNFKLTPANPTNIGISRQCMPQLGGTSQGAFTQTNQISWNDNADNETGFKIYKDGTLIATTGENVQNYTDSFTVISAITVYSPYNYSVAATNPFGDSKTIAATVDPCK